MTEQGLLAMRGISKRFGGVAALSGVSVDFRPGEVHALMGENGAGKSTLMRILSGDVQPDSGEILLEGHPVRFPSPREAEDAGIAMIHQELAMVDTLSVAENLCLGREPLTRFGILDRKALREGAREALDRVGLGVDPDRPAATLPLAARQLLEIGKALGRSARLLVMDEPTSALPEPDARRLLELVRALKAAGTAVVYVSHRLDEVYAVADRITVLRDGQGVESAPARELPRDRLIARMVGRELPPQVPGCRGAPGPVRLRVESLSLGGASGGRPVLDGVTLEVRQGEVLGVAGLAGSGAGELLGAIFERRGAGRVLLDGVPVPAGDPRSAIRAGIALLTEDRKTTGLVLPLDAVRNATLASLPALSPFGLLRRSSERDAATPWLVKAGVDVARLETPVWQLSGGNQQKVALAKWLMIRPKVLLLNEPTRGIDVGAKHEIHGLVRAQADAGAAILLVTSDLPELLALSDRVLVLRRGKITAGLDGRKATQEQVLAAAAA